VRPNFCFGGSSRRVIVDGVDVTVIHGRKFFPNENLPKGVVMSQTRKATITKPRYHPAAYEFVDLALRYSQKKFDKLVGQRREPPAEDAHISGKQLLEGIRELALHEFGLMTIPVFRHWGVNATDDFGRIVWDQIEHGRMRKTDHDLLSDFSGVYDFEAVFDHDYQIDTTHAFRR
jgi:uncharacterized repeat protein (TIGR04138 family)